MRDFLLISTAPDGQSSMERAESAEMALVVGRRLVEQGHKEITVLTPAGKVYILSEYMMLMENLRSPPG
jgi:hypothetical protein